MRTEKAEALEEKLRLHRLGHPTGGTLLRAENKFQKLNAKVGNAQQAAIEARMALQAAQKALLEVEAQAKNAAAAALEADAYPAQVRNGLAGPSRPLEGARQAAEGVLMVAGASRRATPENVVAVANMAIEEAAALAQAVMEGTEPPARKGGAAVQPQDTQLEAFPVPEKRLRAEDAATQVMEADEQLPIFS